MPGAAFSWEEMLMGAYGTSTSDDRSVALTRGEVEAWGKAVGTSTGFLGCFAAVAGACVTDLIAGTFGSGRFGASDVIGIIMG